MRSTFELERNSELKSRGKGAALGQIGLIATLLIYLHAFDSLTPTATTLLLINLIPNSIRFALCLSFAPFLKKISSTKLWDVIFYSAVIATALGWSVLAHYSLFQYGTGSHLTLIVLLLMGGVGSAACTSLSPAPKLARAFTILLLVYPTITLFLSDGTGYHGLAVVFILYAIVLQTQISVQNTTLLKVRQREEQFRALASSSFEGVAMQENGRFIEANISFCKMLGYPHEELIGLEVVKIIPPHEIERLTTLLQNHSEESYEAEFLRKDGTLFFVEGTGRYFSFQDRTVRVSCIRDVTARKKIVEDERRHLEEMRELALARERAALESNQLKSEFLANMSHEIRTPLNGIIGTTELLLESPMPPDQKKYVRIIRDSSDALITIINDVLDFSKIEANKLELEITPFSPVNLIEGQADLLASKAQKKDLSLLVYVDPETPTSLLGDAGRIGQILLNLLSNAVKFTHRGSILLRVQKTTEDAETATLRFSVRDSGVGIPAEVLPKLFQPFTQADGSTARKFGGTGLGLSICKKLVDKMGGEIGIESSPGAGSEFWFTLTFKKLDIAPISRNASLNGIKVQICLNEPELGFIVSSYLEAWGMDPKSLDQHDLKSVQTSKQSDADLWIIDEALINIGFNPFPEKTITVRDFNSTIAHDESLRHVNRPVKQSELYDEIIQFLYPAKAQTPLATQANEPHVHLSKKRILIAEDNTTNQMLALANLQKLGYSAHVVSNGAEAIKELIENENEYDLVLMDCQMPEMDGYAATQWIREHEKTTEHHIPIIALTANAMKQDKDRCLEAGMDDYLTKPLKRETLANMLDKWLPA